VLERGLRRVVTISGAVNCFNCDGCLLHEVFTSLSVSRLVFFGGMLAKDTGKLVQRKDFHAGLQRFLINRRIALSRDEDPSVRRATARLRLSAGQRRQQRAWGARSVVVLSAAARNLIDAEHRIQCAMRDIKRQRWGFEDAAE
jgi:hypothetical protein